MQHLISAQSPPEWPILNRPTLGLYNIFFAKIDMIVNDRISHGHSNRNQPAKARQQNHGQSSRTMYGRMRKTKRRAINTFLIYHGFALKWPIANEMFKLKQAQHDQQVKNLRVQIHDTSLHG